MFYIVYAVSFLELLFFLNLRYDFIDFELSDLDTCKAVLQMFIHCDLINIFRIPYKVQSILLLLHQLQGSILIINVFLNCNSNSLLFFRWLCTGSLSMDSQRQEKLSTSEISQLASCIECRSNYVCPLENRQTGAIHDRSRCKWNISVFYFPFYSFHLYKWLIIIEFYWLFVSVDFEFIGCMSLPWPGSPRNQYNIIIEEYFIENYYRENFVTQKRVNWDVIMAQCTQQTHTRVCSL